MADDDHFMIDISDFINSSEFTPSDEPTDFILPGLRDIGPITITGTWEPWMPSCGICGDKFAVSDDGFVARVTCEALGYSVLACHVCAEPFMHE